MTEITDAADAVATEYGSAHMEDYANMEEKDFYMAMYRETVPQLLNAFAEDITNKEPTSQKWSFTLVDVDGEFIINGIYDA